MNDAKIEVDNEILNEIKQLENKNTCAWINTIKNKSI